MINGDYNKSKTALTMVGGPKSWRFKKLSSSKSWADQSAELTKQLGGQTNNNQLGTKKIKISWGDHRDGRPKIIAQRSVSDLCDLCWDDGGGEGGDQRCIQDAERALLRAPGAAT